MIIKGIFSCCREDYQAVEHFFSLVGKTFTVLIQDYEIASTEASINLLLFLLETGMNAPLYRYFV